MTGLGAHVYRHLQCWLHPYDFANKVGNGRYPGYTKQLEITGQTDFLELPYHQGILNNEIPLSIGGGIGRARTMMMLLLQKTHLGEVSVTVWPQIFKDICAERNIFVLE